MINQAKGSLSGILFRPVPLGYGTLRLFIYGIVLVQLAQGFLAGTRDFVKSYWLVDYSEGFTRRGLAGQLLQFVSGPPSELATIVAGFVVAGLSIAPALILIELLLRERTKAASVVALVLAGSPFVIDQLAYHRRPDMLGFAVLVLTLIAMGWTRARPLLVACCAGGGFAIATLVHEGVALYYLPFAVAAALVMRRWASPFSMITALCVPAGIVCAAVLMSKPAPGAAQRLRDRASFPLEGRTMFDYVESSAADSLLVIRQYSMHSVVLMVLLGVFLLAVHALVLRSQGIPDFFGELQAGLPRKLAIGAIALIGIGYVITFMIGLDWMRWFCIFGASWLACTAALSARGARAARSGAADPITMPAWLLLVVVYAALLAPLNESLGSKQALLYLVPFV